MLKRLGAGVAAICLAISLVLMNAGIGQAQSVVVEKYYVPLPEQALFTSFETINSVSGPPINTTISIAIGGDTIVYYDQWENGYDAVLNVPLDLYSSGEPACPPANHDGTQIWGNGNLCDGIPPEFATDTLGNGDVIVLDNTIPIPRNPAVIRFDGGDKIGASFPIAVTRLAYPSTPGSVLAGGTEVLKTNGWGVSYRAPIGQDVSGATNPWEYARFFVMAENNGTQVFKNGVLQGNINEGENLVIPVNVNDLITSNTPVQVNLLTGDIGSTYEMRWFSVAHTSDYTSEYYAPIGVPADNSNRTAAIWFYNPNQSSSITVNWLIGSTLGSIVVPARQAVFGPYMGGSDGRNGGRFFTQNGAPFYALAQIDASGGGEIYDWGFPLVPSIQLSPQVLVGNGIGCTVPGITIGDDSCDFGNTNNARSFVWVMPTSGTNVPIYVAYDGRPPTCPATSADYNETFNLSALRIRTVQQASNLDMTGARIWTCAANVNLAVVWGQDPLRSFSGDDQGLDLGTAVFPLPSVQMEKSASFAGDHDEDNAISPGDDIAYTLAIVNNGAFAATYTVSDTLPVGMTYLPGSAVYLPANGSVIAIPDSPAPGTPFPLDEGGLSEVNGNPLAIQPGTVDQIQYLVNIDSETDCTSTLTNGAKIIAEVGATESTIQGNDNEVTVLACNPGIRVVKSTNGQDANNPTGPFIASGGAVTWSYLVTNIGDVDLENISLSDDKLGAIISGCAIPAVLDVGASFTCTRNGVAQAGQYANLATVSANSVVSETQIVSDTDPSHYFGQSPSISIRKFTNGHDANPSLGPIVTAGSTVTWSYVVVNTGNVTLTSVAVTDDQIGSVTCPQTILSPQASMTCLETGISASGLYTNVGTVEGVPPVGPPVTDDDPSHYFAAQLALEIKKFTNGVDADTPTGPLLDVGDIVVWTYIVTNTGNVPLAIQVTDSEGLIVACTLGITPPGGQHYCNAYGIAQSGQYSNTGTATATFMGIQVSDSDPSHYFGEFQPDPEPEIAIKKFTNGLDADEPPGPTIQVGGVVTWEYVVVNTGSITLTNVTVTDDPIGAVTCPQTELDLGEFMVCTMTGVAVGGQYTNTGSVIGSAINDGPLVTDTDPSHYFGAVSSVAIEKYTNGEDADTPSGPFISIGEPVTWTYVVTNTGTVELNNIVVTDNQGVNVSCPQLTLAPDEAMTCVGDSGIAQTGQYANIGTVIATPSVGPDVTDSDLSHYFGVDARIEINKFTNGADADDAPGPLVLVGGAVNWSYVVTNSGNVTLTSVTVTDNRGVSVICPQPILGPDATMTCTAAGLAAAGQYSNTGTVVATPPVGPNVTESDPSHYFGVQPGVAIQKYTNGVDANTPTGPLIVIGNNVRWNYVLTNIGNVPLDSFSVTDSRGVLAACPRIVLGVGLSVTCFAVGTAEAGQYDNVGTVTATPPIGNQLTDDDPSHYFGVDASLEFKKYTNGVDADEAPGPTLEVGEEVIWTYVVTNTGNSPLTAIVVNDDQIGVITCPATSLAVGEAMTCTATGIAELGQYANVGDVFAIPPAGAEIVAEDPSHYLGNNPTDLPSEEQPTRPYGAFLPQVNSGVSND